MSYAQSRCASAWDMVWSFRRAENFINIGDFREAESHLKSALDNTNSRTRTIPHRANLSRVVASFFIDTDDFEHANKWLNRAKKIGTKYKFANHMRLVDEIERMMLYKRINAQK